MDRESSLHTSFQAACWEPVQFLQELVLIEKKAGCSQHLRGGIVPFLPLDC